MRRPVSLLFWFLAIAALAAVSQGVREGVREAGRWAPDWVPGWAPPWSPRTPSSTRPLPRGPVTGRAWVIDGDTLQVAGERVRLFGIDAPERYQDCRDGDGQDYICGRAAMRALIGLIGRTPVTCTPLEHDRYDRDVALCMVAGRDLSEAMVRAGQAIELARFSRGRYGAAEREARAARRGLWAGSFERPAEWRHRHGR